jgi:putative glutamine transport system substrate-binding protein
VAQGAAGTLLRKIQDRGKIVVGVKYDQPGFGYLNPMSNQLEGFDVDMGRAIARRIFGDENAVEFKEAISKNRIPYLNDGTVDIVIATMTANEERAQQIDFSDCYYVAGQSLLVKTGSPIKSINDLAGKPVATVKGSTSEKNIRAKAPQATVDLYDTYADGLQAVLSGRAEALTTDDIILYGFAKQNQGQVEVVGGQFTKEPYGMGLQKGHPETVEVVNQVIRELKSNGGWAELFRKHVSEQVPELPPQDWREVAKAQ